MNNKIIPFEKDINRYIRLANLRIEKKDYLGALALHFDGEKICKNHSLNNFLIAEISFFIEPLLSNMPIINGISLR